MTPFRGLVAIRAVGSRGARGAAGAGGRFACEPPFFPNLEAAGDAGYGVDGGELARRRAIALLVSPAPQARTICVRHISECG